MTDMQSVRRGLLLTILVLAGCSGAPDSSRTATTGSNIAMPERAALGEAGITASVVPLAQLPAPVARRYRAAPGEDGVLVIVESDHEGASALPDLDIEGEARDLRGTAWPLAFEQIEADGRRAHVARVGIRGPDTLRLAVRARDNAGHHAELRFSRDIPR